MSGERVDGHAFPVSTIDGYTQYGLTKREAFAMAAMQAYAMRTVSGALLDSEVAAEAVRLADATLVQLARIQPDGQGSK